MRILLAPQAGSLGLGGLTRCRAVAREASLRGHSVAVLCRPSVGGWFSDHVDAVHEAPVPTVHGYGAAANFRLAESLRIRGMDEPAYVDAAVRCELDAYRTWRPDVVFTENQFSTAVSARIARVPYCATAASVNLHGFRSPLYPDMPSPPPVEAAYNAILEHHGLAGAASIGDLVHEHASINIAPTLPELEPALIHLPNVLFCGPLLDGAIELGAFPPPDAPGWDRRLSIYVYMSVGVLEPEEYVPILRELAAQMDVSIWVAIRRNMHDGKPLPQIADRVALYETLPAMSVMKHVHAVVARGGQNTLMAAVLAAKPVLGFAGHSAEADFNLRSMGEYSEIRRCNTSDFTTHELGSSLEQAVAVQPSEKYLRLGARLRGAGGCSAILDRIESL